MVHLVNCSIQSLKWIIVLHLLRGGNSPQGPKVWQYLKMISTQQFRTFWKPTADFWVNINILGFTELKWTRLSEFNSDDQSIYYCGQEYLKRNGVALTVNERVQNAVLGCKIKNKRMISVHFQGKPFTITVIQAYAPTSWRSWSWTALWRSTRPSRTNTKKRRPFHHRGLACKSRKSRYLE